MFKFEFTEYAAKQFKKLSPDGQRRIKQKLYFWQSQSDPLFFAKSLTNFELATHRFRIGSYRLLCRVEKNKFLILVLKVGDRRSIYK